MADANGGFPCSRIALSVQAGEKRCNFSVASVAATADEAFRDVKELLRSESRAWRSYGVFQQLNLLLPAHRRQEATANANASGNAGEAKSLAARSSNAGAASLAFGFSSKDGIDMSSGGLPLPLRTRSSSTMSQSSGGGRYSLCSSWSSSTQRNETARLYQPLSSNSQATTRRPTLGQLPLFAATSAAEAVREAAIQEETEIAARAGVAVLPFVLSASVIPSSAAVRVFFGRSDIFHRGEEEPAVPEPLDISTQEVQPKTRLQLLQCMVADCAAATIQRFFRGYFVRMRFHAAMLLRRILLQQQRREREAASVLQRAWRAVNRRRAELRLQLLREIEHQRESAAVKIQAAWRRRQREFLLQIQLVADCLVNLRNAAAVEIQRVWKGRRCRHTLDEEYEKWVVTWMWDRPSSIVEVVGDFSNPPWKRRYLMNYCQQRECFVLTLPRVPGRHELKFIVNGRHVCDGNQPVISDGAGQFNNLIRVRPAVKSQFKVIRERLAEIAMKQRFQERSFSSPAVPHEQWRREHERSRQKHEMKRQQELEEERREKVRQEREQLRREEEEWIRRQEAIKAEHLQFIRREQIQQEKQYRQSVRDKRKLMEEQRRRVESRCTEEEMVKRRELEAREKEALEEQMRMWNGNRQYDADFLCQKQVNEADQDREQAQDQVGKQEVQEADQSTESRKGEEQPVIIIRNEATEPWFLQQKRLCVPEHDQGFDSDAPIEAEYAFGDLMKSASRSNECHFSLGPHVEGEANISAAQEAACRAEEDSSSSACDLLALTKALAKEEIKEKEKNEAEDADESNSPVVVNATDVLPSPPPLFLEEGSVAVPPFILDPKPLLSTHESESCMPLSLHQSEATLASTEPSDAPSTSTQPQSLLLPTRLENQRNVQDADERSFRGRSTSRRLRKQKGKKQNSRSPGTQGVAEGLANSSFKRKSGDFVWKEG